MIDNVDFELLLTELAVEVPMGRAELIARMKRTFSKEELSHIIVVAGSAMVLHGAKAATVDADCMCDSLHALRQMALRRGIPLSKAVLNGAPRLEVDGFAELFYDPDLHHEVHARVPESARAVTFDGVRCDSIPSLVAWYEMMVRRRGLPKDHQNLAAVKALAVTEAVVPRCLYHGSFFKADVLRPGFDHTGVEITWDVTESNRWLYATGDRTLAIEMGFASALAQVGVQVENFSTEPGRLRVWSRPVVDEKILAKIGRIYLYTVSSNGFHEVRNRHNNAEGEYKRQGEVVPLSVEEISVENFLRGYDAKFKPA